MIILLQLEQGVDKLSVWEYYFYIQWARLWLTNSSSILFENTGCGYEVRCLTCLLYNGDNMSFKLVVLTSEIGELERQLNNILRFLLKNTGNWIEFRDSNRVESVQGIFADNLVFMLLDEPSEEVLETIKAYEEYAIIC